VNGIGETVWSKVFQGSSAQVPTGIAVGPTGQIAIVGRNGGTVSFGGDLLKCSGVDDVFLAAFDGQGAPLWSRSFGSGGPSAAEGIAWDGNGTITIAANAGNNVDFGCGPVMLQGSTGDLALVRFDGAGHAQSAYPVMSTGFTALAARGSRTALSVMAWDDYMDLGGGLVPGHSAPIAVYGP
jgi:hypothetical protein